MRLCTVPNSARFAPPVPEATILPSLWWRKEQYIERSPKRTSAHQRAPGVPHTDPRRSLGAAWRFGCSPSPVFACPHEWSFAPTQPSSTSKWYSLSPTFTQPERSPSCTRFERSPTILPSWYMRMPWHSS